MIRSNDNSNYQLITLLINYHDNKLLWLHEFLRNGLVTYTSFGKVLLYSTEKKKWFILRTDESSMDTKSSVQAQTSGKTPRTGIAEKNWRLPLNSYKNHATQG